MAYAAHFRAADQVIAHLNTVVPTLADPFLASRYAGFTAVSATTVFELAIREILVTFSAKKHTVFGAFAESHLERLNGRIKFEDLRKTHVRKFGLKYEKRFQREAASLDRKILRSHGASILSSYANLITWRHQFAHEGVLPTHATYAEVVSAYELGKQLIDCLDKCMRR